LGHEPEKKVPKQEDEFFDLLTSMQIRFEKLNLSWLTNRVDLNDSRLSDIARVFDALSGDRSAFAAKRSRRLSPDGFLPGFNCLIEFDEAQHFTNARAKSLELYPPATPLGFDREYYLLLCQQHCWNAERKGLPGYRKPKPEFPFEGGRHNQRALFDTMRDLMPALYGLSPTIRISEFDLPSLGISQRQAQAELQAALAGRLH
jgi:hypothetical protein